MVNFEMTFRHHELMASQLQQFPNVSLQGTCTDNTKQFQIFRVNTNRIFISALKHESTVYKNWFNVG